MEIEGWHSFACVSPSLVFDLPLLSLVCLDGPLVVRLSNNGKESHRAESTFN